MVHKCDRQTDDRSRYGEVCSNSWNHLQQLSSWHIFKVFGNTVTTINFIYDIKKCGCKWHIICSNGM